MFLLVVNEAHGMSGVGSRFNIVSRTVSFRSFHVQLHAEQFLIILSFPPAVEGTL